MNIPIYRAKKIDSDEYIIGSTIIKNKMWTSGKGYHDVFYILKDENVSILTRFPVYYPDVVRVDPTTLAIHFPDMLDSQGNKIFASLNEDGKGGDILLEASRLMCNLKIDDSSFREFTAIHTINGNRFVNEKILSDVGNYKDKHFKGFDILIYDFFMMKKRNIKVIGIQE